MTEERKTPKNKEQIMPKDPDFIKSDAWKERERKRKERMKRFRRKVKDDERELHKFSIHQSVRENR